MQDLLYFYKKIHKQYGIKLYMNMIGMMFMSLLEGSVILLLLPLISATGIVDIDTSNIPIVHKIPELHLSLMAILCLFVILMILQNALMYRIQIQQKKIQQGFLYQLRTHLYRKILRADMSLFHTHDKGEMANIMSKEVTRTSTGINMSLQFISTFIFTLIQLSLAFILSPLITILLSCIGALLLLMNRTFLKQSRILGGRNYALGRTYLHGILEQLQGIRDIKSHSLEYGRMKWFGKVSAEMKEEQIQFTKVKSKSQLYYKVAFAFAIALFMYMAIQILHVEGGALLLIVVIFQRLWPSLVDIQGSMEKIIRTFPSFSAIRKLEQVCDDSQEYILQLSGRRKLGPLEKGIRLNNVSFRYEKMKEDIHRNMDINIKAHHLTMICGPSGIGKSTFINLLLGFYKWQKGDILFDGKTMGMNELIYMRRNCGYVSQDPFLFSASIRENLAMDMDDVDDADIWRVLQMTNIESLVQSFKRGLDTVIGDGGLVLSGGEKQRLVIARALLRKPTLLILDEATKGIDIENETVIMRNLSRLKNDMTIILVTHKQHLKVYADQVFTFSKESIRKQDIEAIEKI